MVGVSSGAAATPYRSGPSTYHRRTLPQSFYVFATRPNVCDVGPWFGSSRPGTEVAWDGTVTRMGSTHHRGLAWWSRPGSAGDRFYPLKPVPSVSPIQPSWGRSRPIRSTRRSTGPDACRLVRESIKEFVYLVPSSCLCTDGPFRQATSLGRPTEPGSCLWRVPAVPGHPVLFRYLLEPGGQLRLRFNRNINPVV